MSVRLSVLDQSLVSERTSQTTVITSTVRLEAAVDHLGYIANRC
jgi:hypothetical protein